MQTVNLRAAQNSQPIPLGIGSVMTLTSTIPGGGTGYVEYTLNSLSDINNNLATWTTWPKGSVTLANGGITSDTCLYPVFARAYCTSGQISAVFGDSTDSTATSGVVWASNIVLTTPTGGQAGIFVPATTWANRPLPVTSYPNAIIRITDVGGNTGAGGGNFFFTNSTRWKALGGNITLDTVDTPNTSVANTTEQNLNPNRIGIPAAVISVNGDRLRFRATLTKSGAADTSTIRLRFGPLGTTADPILATITSLATTSISLGVVMDFKRVSATSIQKEGNASTDNAYGGANAGSFPAATTVSDMDANIMFLSITSQMTGGTETVTLQDYALEFWPTDSA